MTGGGSANIDRRCNGTATRTIKETPMHRKPPTRRHALTRLAGVGAAAATLGTPWTGALAQAGTIRMLTGFISRT